MIIIYCRRQHKAASSGSRRTASKMFAFRESHSWRVLPRFFDSFAAADIRLMPIFSVAYTAQPLFISVIDDIGFIFAIENILYASAFTPPVPRRARFSLASLPGCLTAMPPPPHHGIYASAYSLLLSFAGCRRLRLYCRFDASFIASREFSLFAILRGFPQNAHATMKVTAEARWFWAMGRWRLMGTILIFTLSAPFHISRVPLLMFRMVFSRQGRKRLLLEAFRLGFITIVILGWWCLIIDDIFEELFIIFDD